MSTVLETHATEKSTYVVEVSFFDETNTPASPTAVEWTLTDTNGEVINDREGEAGDLLPVIKILLSGSDLAITEGETVPAKRILTVEAVYDSDLGTDLPLKEEFIFYVDNLVIVE